MIAGTEREWSQGRPKGAKFSLDGMGAITLERGGTVLSVPPCLRLWENSSMM